MNARPLLTATLLVVSVAVVVAVDECEPDCIGHDKGDMVADPTDCTQFYICNAGQVPSDEPLSCGSGSHFDPGPPGCVFGSTCDPTCSPYVCHVSCDEPEDLIADPKDCNIYYVCDGALHRGPALKCPVEKPYFGEGNCLPDDSYCCQPRCRAYCGLGDVQIIDPSNCTNYYICTAEGTPDEVNHRHCPTGQVFDVASASCAPDQPCEILCDDIITTTTSTTPGSGCESSYICPGNGFYPLSQTCQAGYYRCSATGECGSPESCPNGLVFNYVPGYEMCVLPSNCPYNPSV